MTVQENFLCRLRSVWKFRTYELNREKRLPSFGFMSPAVQSLAAYPDVVTHDVRFSFVDSTSPKNSSAPTRDHWQPGGGTSVIH